MGCTHDPSIHAQKAESIRRPSEPIASPSYVGAAHPVVTSSFDVESDLREDAAALADDATLSADGGPRLPTAFGPGDVLVDRYQLVEELGRGAHGTVFRAHDRVAGTDVAVKVLSRARRLSPVAMERLRRELRAAWTVTHPSVVRIHDLILLDDQLALSMELVAGETLDRHLARAGTLPRAELVALATDLASALAAAHSAGVTHRDLKPSNIMIRATTNRAVVTDFGLSRMAGVPDAPASATVTGGSSTNLTDTGELVGTPAFMAPEQLRGATDVGPAADVYALGLVLYEAATGKRPHPDQTLHELLRARLESATPSTRSARPDLPAKLTQTIEDCLQVDSAARIADGSAVLRRLAEIDEQPRRWWFAGAAAIVVAGVAVGVFAFGGRHDAATCGDGHGELLGTWGIAQRAAVSRAFAATGVSYATDASERVTAAFDQWTAAWTAEYHEGCADTRRLACLDQLRTEAGSLASLLEMADRAVVEHAVSAVQSLPPPAQCGTRTAMLVQVAPPPADQAARVEDLRAQIRAVLVRVDLGQLTSAAATISGIVDAAVHTGYKPLIAEAYFERGLIEHGLGRKEALDSLEESALAAEASRDDYAAANASILMIEVLTFAERLDDARREGRRADAAIHRFGGAPALEAALARALGILEMHAEAFDRAVEDLQHAAAIDERRGDAAMVATDRTNLAEVYGNLGRYQDGVDLSRKILADNERAFGPEHPNVAATLNTLGLDLMQLGKLDDAESIEARSLAIYLETEGPTGDEAYLTRQRLAVIHSRQPDRATQARGELEQLVSDMLRTHPADSSTVLEARGNLVVVLGALGDYDRAELELREVIAARHETSASYAANDYVNLSGILHLAGRDREALEPARHALAMLEQAGDDKQPTGAFALTNLGDAERALGSLADAEGHYKRAQTIFEATFGADHVTLAYPLTGLGRIALARHQAAVARPLLERALALRAGGDPLELGEAQLALAMALTDLGQATQGKAMGTAAVASYVAAGDRAASRSRAAARAWLAAHWRSPSPRGAIFCKVQPASAPASRSTRRVDSLIDTS